MTGPELLLVAAGGFVAGVVNAIAGGGSLVSFPALLAVGLDPVAANVTNTVGIWPGYLSGAVGFRGELAGQRRRGLVLGATATAGSVIGVVLLLALPNAVFDAAVPWCVLFASGLLAAQPRVAAWLRSRPRRRHVEEDRAVGLHVALFAGGAYGAYFGGGLGVVLLGVLGLFLSDHLHRIIGLKNVLSFLVNTLALVAFVVFAPVAWNAFAVLAPTALLGGYTGARVAKLVPAPILRATIVATGTAVGLVLLVG